MCLPGADLLPIRVERAAVGFVGRVVLPSKWSLFRASHRDHSTHGSIVFRTPVGRRQVASLNLTIIDVIVSSTVVGISCLRGTNSQTLLA